MAIYKRGENQIGLAQRAAEQRRQQDEIDRLYESIRDTASVETNTIRRGRLHSFNVAHRDPTIQSLIENSVLDIPISGDDLARGKSIRRLMEE